MSSPPLIRWLVWWPSTSRRSETRTLGLGWQTTNSNDIGKLQTQSMWSGVRLIWGTARALPLSSHVILADSKPQDSANTLESGDDDWPYYPRLIYKPSKKGCSKERVLSVIHSTSLTSLLPLLCGDQCYPSVTNEETDTKKKFIQGTQGELSMVQTLLCP